MSQRPEVEKVDDEKHEVSALEYAVQDANEEDGRKKKFNANNQLDEAARILSEAGPVEFDAAEKKRVLRRIDLYVCIPMCIMYLCQQLDKSSLGYAAVFDLREATHLKGTEYSWLTSIVYIAQFISQPLSAYALIVFPVKWWILANFFLWSVTTICTAAAKNFVGLIIARFFLGAFEATILPAFIFITQMWYTRREHAYRTTAYQLSNSVAGIIGPLITWGVGHAGGKGLYAYQAIFICLGCISLAFVPVVLWLLPSSPTSARFLRRGDDRLIALDRIKENQTGTKSSNWKWAQCWEAFRDPKTYAWALMFFLMSAPPGGLGAFGALIIKGLGFSSFSSILMQMPVGVIGMICMTLWTWLVNKIKLRWPVVSFTLPFPIVGAALLTHYDARNIPAMMVGYYIIFVGTVPQIMYSWANLNAAGSTKRVVTTAFMFCGMCAGNVVGPQVYLAREAPRYRTGLYFAMACWALHSVLAALMGLYLRHLNKKQEARREALGLPAKLKDISIMDLDEADAYRAELMEQLRRAGGSTEAELFGNAFDDLTDFENPMFIYVL